MQPRRKPKKDSLVELIKIYGNSEEECVNFFFKAKWPTGFYCEKCGCVHYYSIERGHVFECAECGHQHYLLSGTIFQDSKLPLFKLILGLYLFFVANKGLSAIEMASALDVNYKTALLLCRKCRVLMAESNAEKKLNSKFLEADTFFVGATSEGKPGVASEQQPVLVVLSTDRENSYPSYVKFHVMNKENTENVEKFLTQMAHISKDVTLNTDGKFCFADFRYRLNLKAEKIIYSEENHRLKWINIIIGNLKNQILGIYHGISKRDLPLFLHEQEWRFNHRYSGSHILDKIQKYILKSSPMTKEKITFIMNLSEPHFSRACV